MCRGAGHGADFATLTPQRTVILKMELDVNYQPESQASLSSSLYLGDSETYLYFVESFALSTCILSNPPKLAFCELECFLLSLIFTTLLLSAFPSPFHLFSEYVSSAYHVAGAVLGPGYTSVNKTGNNPWPRRLTF